MNLRATVEVLMQFNDESDSWCDVMVCMQCVGSFLDVQWPQAALVPVRTKKRYFIPPAVGLKERSHTEQEAKARAAGVVIRQEYMERPINISCTGGSRS